MPNHLFSNRNLVVQFSIVNLELEADKVWQYHCRASLRPNDLSPLAGLCWLNVERVDVRTYMRISSVALLCRAISLTRIGEAIGNDLPFHTERASSALVGNMMDCRDEIGIEYDCDALEFLRSGGCGETHSEG